MAGSRFSTLFVAWRTIGIVAIVALGSQLGAAGARAEVARNQVTGLTVAQGDGFATLAWTKVEGATEYQIVRTPVDAADVPGASL
jgi:hypothetical protein